MRRAGEFFAGIASVFGVGNAEVPQEQPNVEPQAVVAEMQESLEETSEWEIGVYAPALRGLRDLADGKIGLDRLLEDAAVPFYVSATHHEGAAPELSVRFPVDQLKEEATKQVEQDLNIVRGLSWNVDDYQSVANEPSALLELVGIDAARVEAKRLAGTESLSDEQYAKLIGLSESLGYAGTYEDAVFQTLVDYGNGSLNNPEAAAEIEKMFVQNGVEEIQLKSPEGTSETFLLPVPVFFALMARGVARAVPEALARTQQAMRPGRLTRELIGIGRVLTAPERRGRFFAPPIEIPAEAEAQNVEQVVAGTMNALDQSIPSNAEILRDIQTVLTRRAEIRGALLDRWTLMDNQRRVARGEEAAPHQALDARQRFFAEMQSVALLSLQNELGSQQQAITESNVRRVMAEAPVRARMAEAVRLAHRLMRPASVE